MARVILHADKRIFGFLCREKKIKCNNNLFKYSYWNSSQRKNQPTPTSSDCNLGSNEQRNGKSKLENIKMDVEQMKERSEINYLEQSLLPTLLALTPSTHFKNPNVQSFTESHPIAPPQRVAPRGCTCHGHPLFHSSRKTSVPELASRHVANDHLPLPPVQRFYYRPR